jgi:hypothetical protein
VQGNAKSNQEVSPFYHIYRDGTDIAKTQVSNGTGYFRIPMSFLYIDRPVAGKHTYKVFVDFDKIGDTTLSKCQFFTWQMR